MLPDLDGRIRAEIDQASAQVKGCDPDSFVRLAADELRDALLAVIERHKPNPTLNGLGPYCEVCVGGYEGVSEWPCETVKDIAEKLGVQAQGSRRSDCSNPRASTPSSRDTSGPTRDPPTLVTCSAGT